MLKVRLLLTIINTEGYKLIDKFEYKLVNLLETKIVLLN